MLTISSLPGTLVKHTTPQSNQITPHTYSQVLLTMAMAYSNGLGQLGNAIIGGYGFRQKSAPIYATSNKDIGLPAITTPDGELKALIKVVKTTLDLIELVTDLRQRRRQLAFIVSCSQKGLIKLVLIPAANMVADALTKNYGPLTHWRRIANLLGESPELIRLRDIVV